jgi:uncharacterized membrane protein YkoI
MQRFRIALAVLLVWVVGLAAWADDQKDDKVSAQNKPALAKEVLGTAKIDMKTAVEAAQKIVPEGKPLAVRAESKEGKARFGCYFLNGDIVREVEIDAVSGDMMESKDAQGSKKVNGQTLDDAKKAVEGVTVTLAQAIGIGSDKVKNGKPFEAEIRMEDGKVVIEVELLAEDKIVKVQVGARDPKSVKIVEPKNK